MVNHPNQSQDEIFDHLRRYYRSLGLHAWLKVKVFSRQGIYYMQLLSRSNILNFSGLEIGPPLFQDLGQDSCNKTRKWGVARQPRGSGSGRQSWFLKLRWKAGCHPRIVADQPWNGRQQIEWGRWRKWKGSGQVRIPVGHRCWVGWMKRCLGRPSHIGTVGLDRTEAGP